MRQMRSGAGSGRAGYEDPEDRRRRIARKAAQYPNTIMSNDSDGAQGVSGVSGDGPDGTDGGVSG